MKLFVVFCCFLFVFYYYKSVGDERAPFVENITVNMFSLLHVVQECKREQVDLALEDHLSNVQGAPGWLFDIGDDILPNYMGIIS